MSAGILRDGSWRDFYASLYIWNTRMKSICSKSIDNTDGGR
jgi:hypothetical protein